MRFIEQEERDPNVELTECNVHDILASAVQLLLGEVAPKGSVEQEILVDCSGCIDQITINPTQPDKFTPELKVKWERKLNELVAHLRELDSEYHADAEYTC